MNTPELRQAEFCRELARRLAAGIEEHEAERATSRWKGHANMYSYPKAQAVEDIRRLRRELTSLRKMMEEYSDVDTNK